MTLSDSVGTIVRPYGWGAAAKPTAFNVAQTVGSNNLPTAYDCHTYGDRL